jgi:hypothetical protein
VRDPSGRVDFFSEREFNSSWTQRGAPSAFTDTHASAESRVKEIFRQWLPGVSAAHPRRGPYKGRLTSESNALLIGKVAG